ncbi:hypothetical protein ACFHYQ_24200 [Sphaerimonospora cavernae]|uniref:Transposase n=1 Tax=Sphaerimonospora cavernae TaxID=1740611 RepID=A0ABV6UB20_9ACTN
MSWPMYALRKEWNRVKRQVAPWWAECSKEASPPIWSGWPPR